MTSIARTMLEWSFEPASFFEECCVFEYADGEIIIDTGKAVGEFDPARYQEGRPFRDLAHEFLFTVFLAQQVQVHTSFTLAAPSMALVHPNGRRDVSLFIDSCVVTVSVGSVDLIHRDAAGNVIADTKAERLLTQKEFRASVARLLPQDIALKRMLQSFHNALNDQDNLLIHLYEIRETLKTEFSNENAAWNAFGVSSGDWRKFGQLANNEPLLEGRHRGKHHSLRKAAPEEAIWALGFGRRLIEGYIRHLTK